MQPVNGGRRQRRIVGPAQLKHAAVGEGEIGARRALLLWLTAPPLAAILGWIFLGESIATLGWVGIALTLVGIGVVQSEKDEKEGDKEPLSRKILLIGTGAGIIFKGSGFYETDYRSESYKAGVKKESESNKPKSDSKSKTDSKSKPDKNGGKSPPKK